MCFYLFQIKIFGGLKDGCEIVHGSGVRRSCITDRPTSFCHHQGIYFDLIFSFMTYFVFCFTMFKSLRFTHF